MKVLLDSNVWIAGLIARGTCAELIDHCLVEHQLPISDWISKEIIEVLTTRFEYPLDRIREVESWLRDVADLFRLDGDPPNICRDPDDNYVLLTAYQVEAACIVTGDRDLLDLKRFEGISVVLPNAFWQLEHRLEMKRRDKENPDKM